MAKINAHQQRARIFNRQATEAHLRGNQVAAYEARYAFLTEIAEANRLSNQLKGRTT
jgi:hypothetical protein